MHLAFPVVASRLMGMSQFSILTEPPIFGNPTEKT